MGLGPPEAKPNDIICLFPGSRVPFILRKQSNGYYSLVGECYVHGIMLGEEMVQFGKLPPEERKLDEFVIE